MTSVQEERDLIIRDHTQLWDGCSARGAMGETQLLQDVEDEVESRFVCFAEMRGYLGLFDGDREDGLRKSPIKLNGSTIATDQASVALDFHLKGNAS